MTLSAREAHDATIISQPDLEEFWRALMGDGGFGQRSVWLAFFDSGRRPLPVLIPIDELPVEPEPQLANLGAMIAGVAHEQDVVAVAMLLSRPGSSAPTARDRRWARGLYGACTQLTTQVWPLHLATHDHVSVLDPHDLG